MSLDPKAHSGMLEAALDYPLGDKLPAPGQTLELADGVRWMRAPLPFTLNHINLWLLRDEIEGQHGWTVVDCGIDDAATRAAWERVFADELGGLPVLRVIVTHMHPDHIGLAHWLCERWSRPGRDCRLWISGTDWNVAHKATVSSAGFGGEGMAEFFSHHGLTDPQDLQALRERTSGYTGMVPRVPARYRRLRDNMPLNVNGNIWQCIAGYGHAPEHMALFGAAAGVLIAGDMVLPRITTNVSVFEFEPEDDPLTLYLASIQRFKDLPADTLVLPSHGKPFRGLHARIAQLVQHHDERFEIALQACGKRPCTAADLLPALFQRDLDLHQTTFALGEALAHLHALLYRGQLRFEDGTDGQRRFLRT